MDILSLILEIFLFVGLSFVQGELFYYNVSECYSMGRIDRIIVKDVCSEGFNQSSVELIPDCNKEINISRSSLQEVALLRQQNFDNLTKENFSCYSVVTEHSYVEIAASLDQRRCHPDVLQVELTACQTPPQIAVYLREFSTSGLLCNYTNEQSVKDVFCQNLFTIIQGNITLKTKEKCPESDGCLELTPMPFLWSSIKTRIFKVEPVIGKSVRRCNVNLDVQSNEDFSIELNIVNAKFKTLINRATFIVNSSSKMVLNMDMKAFSSDLERFYFQLQLKNLSSVFYIYTLYISPGCFVKEKSIVHGDQNYPPKGETSAPFPFEGINTVLGNKRDFNLRYSSERPATSLFEEKKVVGGRNDSIRKTSRTRFSFNDLSTRGLHCNYTNQQDLVDTFCEELFVANQNKCTLEKMADCSPFGDCLKFTPKGTTCFRPIFNTTILNTVTVNETVSCNVTLVVEFPTVITPVTVKMVVVDAEDKQTINEKTFRVNDPPTGKREVLELDIESFPPDIKMYYVFLQFRAFVENSRIYAFSLSPGCFHRVPVLDMDRFKETNSILALVLPSAFVAIAVILLAILARKKKKMFPFKVGDKKLISDCFRETSCKLGDNLTIKKNPNYHWYLTCLQNPVPEFLWSDVTIIGTIGEGEFGIVNEGKLTLNRNLKQQVDIAVKELKLENGKDCLSSFYLEASTLCGLNHQNIVKCYGIAKNPKRMGIILELMDTNLKSYLQAFTDSTNSTLLTVDAGIKLASDICTACVYLENNKFVHRDIAARNCLVKSVGPDVVVKIGDFGMARRTSVSEYYKKEGTAMLPVRWLPPEALSGVFTSKSDVWAFGVLVWEIFTGGCLPYPGMSISEVFIVIKQGGNMAAYRPTKCPDDVWRILTKCWSYNSEERPSFTELETILKQRGRGLPSLHTQGNDKNALITQSYLEEESECLLCQ